MSIHAAKEALIRKHLKLARIPACKDPRHGATCSCNHASHIEGWDLNQPVGERTLERGERLMQFVSNASASNPTSETGNYFTWAGGHGMGDVGVGSGLSGRTQYEFQVARSVLALFGSAARIRRKVGAASGHSLRGDGGADQSFLADRGMSSLVPGNADLGDY